MIALDHLAVVARTLAEGAAHVAAALGVTPDPGGRHGGFGTRNLLLRLGPDIYLEVIAPDPDAPEPPRWFGLAGGVGSPRLAAFVARADDLDAAVAGHPGGLAPPVKMARGDHAWRFAATPDGDLPAHGLPYLLAWDGPHPCERLPDRGLRLIRFAIVTPDPGVRAYLARIAGVEVNPGPEIVLAAQVETPGGVRTLR